ncbi:MAG: SAP domain-containing protein [Anaerolineaceae bacterium]|nr:SAP domain-containing protein [Anaerolineaceae bacterium]
MRPKLNKAIDPEQFRNYYWLKEELTDFCKNVSIPGNGSKQELTDRIFHYLKTGQVLIAATNSLKRILKDSPLSLDSKIPEGYRNDKIHRAFFKKEIGEHFKFNVPFMNWMKANPGKTYQEAVNEWKRILKEKKAGKKYKISSQFEYNQYTRDFFEKNPNSSRDDAITCWKYKKSLPGYNGYEKEDLVVLSK